MPVANPISKEKMISELEKSETVGQAAESLGVTRQNINKRLKKYGLKTVITKKLKVVRR